MKLTYKGETYKLLGCGDRDKVEVIGITGGGYRICKVIETGEIVAMYLPNDTTWAPAI